MEDPLENLKYDVERHEDAVIQDSSDIARLKADVSELIELLKLLNIFVHRTTGGRAVDEASDEFRKRLRAILEKHGIPE